MLTTLSFPYSQSLAKLTANFQSSLSICDSAGEVANSTGTAGDSCGLQQFCDTGCQTDILGEVGDAAAAPPTNTEAKTITFRPKIRISCSGHD